MFIGRQCHCLRPCHPWAADLVEYWHTTNKGLNVVDNLKISQSYLSGRQNRPGFDGQVRNALIDGILLLLTSQITMPF